jgi:hypothetical protein
MNGYSLAISSPLCRRIVVVILDIFILILLSADVLTSAYGRGRNPDNCELVANSETLVGLESI